MSKRPADSPHHTRPAKLQNTAPNTIEFLGEECLPVEHADIDRALAADIRAYFPNGVNWYDLAVCYGIIQARCPDLFEIFDSASVKNVLVMQMKELWPLLEEAYNTNNYKQIMLVKHFRRPSSYSHSTARKSETSSAVKDAQDAWRVPFVGDAHNALAANLRNMYTESIAPKMRDTLYKSHAAIIQSSGSGKSRMVDEVSKLIFTIPFNIREAHENGAWPPPDESIRDLFLEEFGTRFSEEQLSLRFLCFFQAAFEQIAETITTHFNSVFPDRTAFALGWHQYLAQGRNRADLYKAVVARTTELVKNNASMAPNGRLEPEARLRLEAAPVLALRKLVALVCRLSRCSLNGSSLDTDEGIRPKDSATQDITRLHVFIYFDEAHVLKENQLRDSDRYPFDILAQTLEILQAQGAFTVFLSTQFNREPWKPRSPLARSARYRRLYGNANAPITETPFDCFGSRRLNPSRLKAADVDRVELMACFGRPLWKAMLSVECDAALDEYSKEGSVSGESEAVVLPEAGKRGRDLIDLACKKLLCSSSTEDALRTYTQEARTAVLDARIMLSYNASCPAAQWHVEQLVANHMRTVYSIPQSCQYIRSSYSSEPILAEAAAHQLFTWRSRQNPIFDLSPEVSILEHNLQDDLLSRGEICETVGRLLLILARDQAAVDSFRISSPTLSFSKHISVEAFFNALLPNDAAQRVLNCTPDNQVLDQNARTFREMYKDAVLNFTHFANWADESAMTEDGAVGCFIRHMAVICRNTAAIVDVFIPILMDKSAALEPEVMSGIFVQFKVREQAGSYSAYAIDEKKVGFFSPNANENALRPYISLTMELGATNPPQLLAQTHVNYRSNAAGIHGADEVTKPSTPSRNHTPPAPMRSLQTTVHPRFSIYINGCSPSVYKVISERDRILYKAIIRSGDLLREHPRQDRKTLSVVRNQKPVFCTGRTYWHWIQSEILNVDDPQLESEVEGIFFDIEAETDDPLLPMQREFP